MMAYIRALGQTPFTVIVRQIEKASVKKSCLGFIMMGSLVRVKKTAIPLRPEGQPNMSEQQRSKVTFLVNQKEKLWIPVDLFLNDPNLFD
jgi:hypothetical protein